MYGSSILCSTSHNIRRSRCGFACAVSRSYVYKSSSGRSIRLWGKRLIELGCSYKEYVPCTEQYRYLDLKPKFRREYRDQNITGHRTDKLLCVSRDFPQPPALHEYFDKSNTDRQAGAKYRLLLADRRSRQKRQTLSRSGLVFRNKIEQKTRLYNHVRWFFSFKNGSHIPADHY